MVFFRVGLAKGMGLVEWLVADELKKTKQASVR